MAVIYIGDRNTGKTALAIELTNSQFDYVHIPNQSYDNLKALFFDETEDKFRPTPVDPTNVYTTRSLQVEVKLPAGRKTISVDWIDTPGEVWRKSWQLDNPQKWHQVLAAVKQSEGILLVLPPYREMLSPQAPVDFSEFPTQQQWCNRFQRWVDFFHDDCPKVRHIVICLNKADLFCDLDQEAFQLAYHPLRSRKTWYQRNSYVSQRYFRPIQRQLVAISQPPAGVPVRCFITSIYNRSLLELPWIYLASFLAS
ncbi:MAG: hypothetical protein F6K56_09450 [Moorea sp. SIO3G5]|nr:hypothetical protein [Moorena sp. SIO3G5]